MLEGGLRYDALRGNDLTILSVIIKGNTLYESHLRVCICASYSAHQEIMLQMLRPIVLLSRLKHDGPRCFLFDCIFAEHSLTRATLVSSEEAFIGSHF